MLEWLNDVDVQLFLALNGKHNGFFDFVMYWASTRFIWIPFYAFLLYLLLKQYKKGIPITLLFVVLLITLSDKIASGLIKPLVQRLRPCHNPFIEKLVHLNPDCGGAYGFVSSHATNAFALSCFLIILLGHKHSWLKWVLFPWAALVAYSRVYNGVHYPGDIICGGLVGAIVGVTVASVLKRYHAKNNVL